MKHLVCTGALAMALLAPCAASAQQAVSWDAFGQARSTSRDRKVVVDFPAALAAVHGKVVTLKGFMVPLEAKLEQSHFLLTSTLQDCQFCMEGGPTTYVEVRASVPLKFSSQPFTLVGKLQLLRDDPSGVYYRLLDARPARAS